jgi:diguanylate cyclase (GGDEF)-like protein
MLKVLSREEPPVGIRLSDTINLLVASEPVDSMVESVLGSLAVDLGAYCAQLWVPAADGRYLTCDTTSYMCSADVRDFVRASRALKCPVGAGLPGLAFASGSTARLDRTEDEQGLARRHTSLPGGLAVSSVALPVVAGGAVCGVLEMLFEWPGPALHLDDVALRLALAPLGLALLGRHHAVPPVAETSVPPGSALPGRSAALAWLRQQDREVALALCDLRDFGRINQVHGHAVGDEALAVVGRRVAAVAGPDGLAARIAGDEFVVAWPVPATKASGLVDALAEALAPPVPAANGLLAVQARIGYAAGAAHADLLDIAGLALREAKRTSQDAVYYSPALRSEVEERATLAPALAAAIAAGQVGVHYQAIVNASTGAVQGCEALARWTHPQLGPVSPAVFVPLAEQTGQIDALTRLVLRTALTEQREWVARFGPAAPEYVAVNVTGPQIIDPNFLQTVRDALDGAGVPATALALEVTETSLMTDLDAAVRYLLALTGLGVRVHIDDFGTGYSSLAYLNRLPADTLKIDREFVARLGEDERTEAMLSSVLGLAQQLGLRCVAEGVETEPQLHWLREHGCDLVQGYYLCRPLPAGEFAPWLREQHPGAN